MARASTLRFSRPRAMARKTLPGRERSFTSFSSFTWEFPQLGAWPSPLGSAKVHNRPFRSFSRRGRSWFPRVWPPFFRVSSSSTAPIVAGHWARRGRPTKDSVHRRPELGLFRALGHPPPCPACTMYCVRLRGHAYASNLEAPRLRITGHTYSVLCPDKALDVACVPLTRRFVVTSVDLTTPPGPAPTGSGPAGPAAPS